MRFAGYRIPHPLENRLELRVQTAPTTNPPEVVKKALDSLVDDVRRGAPARDMFPRRVRWLLHPRHYSD